MTTRHVALPAHDSSSGNVFRDLGFDRPDEELAKANLIMQIADLVRERKVPQSATATLLRLPQSKVSLLLRGHSNGFSIGRLLLLLTRLGHDVDIVIRPRRRSGRQARLKVRHPSSARRAS
jgi:predicted XRE-type DNA-binding protein